jgi:hypothetical protein
MIRSVYGRIGLSRRRACSKSNSRISQTLINVNRLLNQEISNEEDAYLCSLGNIVINDSFVDALLVGIYYHGLWSILFGLCFAPCEGEFRSFGCLRQMGLMLLMWGNLVLLSIWC